MMVSFGSGDRSRIVAQQITMQALAERLGSEMKTIVTDATGLTAKYDFVLTFFREGATLPNGETLPTIFNALQSQLGLKAESKKGTQTLVVIDHVEKTPTPN